MIKLNETQKKVILIGLVVIILMGLFPPWKCIYCNLEGACVKRLAGYKFIFSPPYCGGSDAEIEKDRLILQWIIVIMITGLAVYFTSTQVNFFHQNKKSNSSYNSERKEKIE